MSKKIFFYIPFLLLLNLFAFSQDAGSKGLTFTSTAGASSSGNNYAIIVGVTKYSNEKMNTLQYAHTDAINFLNFLRLGYMGHFDRKNVKFYINDTATSGNFNASLSTWLGDELQDKVKPGDNIFIFYSGHGVISGDKLNLTCTNTNYIQDLDKLTQGIGISVIKSYTEYYTDKNKGVNVYLIVDACRDGATDPKGLESAENIDGPGENLFYGASNGQPSYETPLLNNGNGAGVFTYFLLLGLHGAAASADNTVSMAGLKSFVESNVNNYATHILGHKEVGQSPFIKFGDGHAWQKIIASVPKDTVAKYKNIFAGISAKIDAAKSTEKGFTLPYTSYSYIADNFIVDTAYYPTPESTDSASRELFHQMKTAIAKGLLVAPEGKSAFDYYEQLKLQEPTSDLVSQAKEQLFASLVDKSQNTIDNYVSGKLKETNKSVFELACSELTHLQQLIKDTNPYNETIAPKILFLKSRALAGSVDPKDWELANNIIDSALVLAPNTAYSYHTKALIAAHQEKHLSAVNYFRKAIKLAPNWVFPLYSLAEEYYELGEYDKSLKYCYSAIRKDSNYAYPYALIALNYENVKMYDSAIYWNKKALQIDSSFTYPYYYLGRIYTQKLQNIDNNVNIGKKCFYKGIHQYDDRNSVYGIYYFYRYTDYNKDSMQYYISYMLNKFPTYKSSNIEYAYKLQQIDKDSVAADSFFHFLLQKEGNNNNLWADYAYFSYTFRSASLGDSMYKLALKYNEEDPDTYRRHAYAAYSVGKDINKAKSIYHDGIKKIHNSPELYYNFGKFFFTNQFDAKIGPYALDSALHYFHLAMELNKEYSYCYMMMYNVFIKLGQIDSAKHYIKIARTLNKYIDSVNSFNIDVNILANKAIEKGEYQLALKYCSIRYETDKSFESFYQLSYINFLLGNEAIAYKLLTSYKKELEIDQLRQYNQLLGLILLNQGKYDQALNIFINLDEQLRPETDHTEQIACYLKLQEIDKAKELMNAEKENNPEYDFYNIIKSQKIFSRIFKNEKIK